jgi:hypothetical protein
MLVPVGATPEFEEARRRYGDLSTVVSSFAESYGGRVGEGGRAKTCRAIVRPWPDEGGTPNANGKRWTEDRGRLTASFGSAASSLDFVWLFSFMQISAWIDLERGG